MSATWPACYDHIFTRLDRLRQVAPQSWEACCPAHDDKRPSLTLRIGRDGNLLIKCQRNQGEGCPTALVMSAIDCTLEDLWPDNKRFTGGGYKSKVTKKFSASYDYRDEAGTLLFQVLRFTLPEGKKEFRQRRPVVGEKEGWAYNLHGVRRVLYRLPDLAREKAKHSPIACPRAVLVEGEKVADALWRLGVPATTNPGGAGKFGLCDFTALAGWNVAVLPDNDPYDPKLHSWVGQDHAEEACRLLYPIAAQVKYVDLPDLPIKGDAFDWINARRKAGESSEHIREALWWAVHRAPVWVPPCQPHPLYARAEQRLRSTLSEYATSAQWAAKALDLASEIAEATKEGALIETADYAADLVALLMAGAESFLEMRRPERSLPQPPGKEE